MKDYWALWGLAFVILFAMFVLAPFMKSMGF